mgnify:FL=1
MKKKLFSLALAAALSLTLLAGCSGGTQPSASPSTEPSETPSASTPVESTPVENVKLRVGASPTPHAEILEFAKSLLAEQGVDLEIVEFDDYVLPNTAVEEGDLDANYFQHLPYLENFNAENGTHLVSVGAIHYEPFGIYAGKTASLADLPDGATISVPNDGTNEARALLLLEQEGLIKLKEDAGLNATKESIVENPHNYEIVELEAKLLPETLQDVDISVINGNYAIGAGLKVADALATESAEGLGASTFANIIAVKEGNEDNAAVKALLDVLQSDAVKAFIEETYEGAVVPVF